MRRRQSGRTLRSSKPCGLCSPSVPAAREEQFGTDYAIRQILSNALVSDEVVDIFKVAGLEKPDISILSDEFSSRSSARPERTSPWTY